MATFVHITDEKNIAAIKRNGLKAEKIHYEKAERGVFCMPVISDYFAVHQWCRELMRFGVKNPCGVYFKINDNETVLFGKYNGMHKKETASKVTAIFSDMEDRMGFQAVVPHKIQLSEIQKIRSIRPMGWRYYPAAKGRKPCLCPVCIQPGEYGSRKMLEQKLKENYKHYKRSTETQEKTYALSTISDLIRDHHVPFPEWERLLEVNILHQSQLMIAIGDVLMSLKNSQALDAYFQFVKEAEPEVQRWFASQILYAYGDAERKYLEPFLDVPEVVEEMREYEEWVED